MSQNPLPAPRGDAQRGAADHHDRVSAMFDAIAGRYDLMNAVMTWGQEPRLVRRTVARANIPAQARVLDLATAPATSRSRCSSGTPTHRWWARTSPPR